MSTATFNTWLNPNGTENYKCRAWVNFDGTTSPGTIRASGNVSSVTKNNTGRYTVNLTTAMPDANYTTISMCQTNHTGGFQNSVVSQDSNQTQTTTAVPLQIREGTFVVDSSFVYVAIFR
jgi:hypothetical protein